MSSLIFFTTHSPAPAGLLEITEFCFFFSPWLRALQRSEWFNSFSFLHRGGQAIRDFWWWRLARFLGIVQIAF